MTVAELIEELSKLDQEAELSIIDDEIVVEVGEDEVEGYVSVRVG